MLITTTILASLALPAPGLEWHRGDLGSALERAADDGRSTVLYFWRDGSEYCASFYQETLADERVIEALRSSLLVSAQHGTEAGDALFAEFGVTSLPTLLFLRPDGSPDDIVAGHAPADVLLYELERIRGGEYTVTDLERRIASAEPGTEEHFEARFRLAVKRKDLGDREAWIAGLRSIRDDDARGTTLHGARAVLRLAEHEVSEAAGDGAEDLRLGPLRSVARKLVNEEGRFEAFDLLASLEIRNGDREAACRTLRKAAEIVPEGREMDWSGNTAYGLMAYGNEPGRAERELVLDLALRAVELAAVAEPYGGETDYEYAPPSRVHASYLAVLARAYDVAGDARLASATAKRAVELDPSDAMRERVAELL